MTRDLLPLFILVTGTACAISCGGESGGPAGADAGAGADAAPQPDGGGGSSPDASTPESATAFAVATDFATAGVASTVSIPDLDVTQEALAGVSSTDPVVRRFGDRIYVINRFGADNVTIVDAKEMTLVDQISTGGGSNPQDVAVMGQKIYVAALGSAGVLVLDATDPDAGVVDTIDLSELDPEDELPNCGTLSRAGNELFVVCGVLDDEDQFLSPRGPGKVAVIDLADHSISDTFSLENQRPFGFLQPTAAEGEYEGDLLIATVPSFADLTQGCIERIGADGTSGGCLIQNSELGGYASGYREAGGTLWLAITTGYDDADFGPVGELRTYDGAALGDPMTPEAQRPFDVARCPTGHLVVADAAGGVRVYGEDGTELTDEVLDLGMPPVANGLTCF